MWCQDSNLHPLDHRFPPITTRPGLTHPIFENRFVWVEQVSEVVLTSVTIFGEIGQNLNILWHILRGYLFSIWRKLLTYLGQFFMLNICLHWPVDFQDFQRPVPFCKSNYIFYGYLLSFSIRSFCLLRI